jgi:hypothetical protein
MALNVAIMPLTERLKEVLTRSKKNFGPDVSQALDSLLSPTNLAILAGTLTLWVGSHVFGVGEIVDVLKSPALSLAIRSRLDPRRVVLGDVELLELCPRRDCLCPPPPLIRREELGDEVDVTTVRDPLESLHLVQRDVLPDEVAVSWVLAARHLFFSPAIQAIPDSGLPTNLRRHQMGLRDDEVLRFVVARVVLDSELQVEAAFHVPHTRLAQ